MLEGKKYILLIVAAIILIIAAVVIASSFGVILKVTDKYSCKYSPQMNSKDGFLSASNTLMFLAIAVSIIDRIIA